MILLALAVLRHGLALFARRGSAAGRPTTRLLVLGRDRLSRGADLCRCCATSSSSRSAPGASRAPAHLDLGADLAVVRDFGPGGLARRADRGAETVFVGLLRRSLIVAGLADAVAAAVADEDRAPPGPRLARAGAGGGLGFLAGIVGIGGGIFLAPSLYLLRWGRRRRRSPRPAPPSSWSIRSRALPGRRAKAVGATGER